jgi:hypothetical protein
MKTIATRKGFLAVKPPSFQKIETKNTSGFSIVAQRTELIAAPLVMDYVLDGITLKAGVINVILPGDAGLHPWAKKVMSFNGIEFALCPEHIVVGYQETSRGAE